MASYETIENAMIDALAEDESMRNWTLEESRRLLLKMRVFQMGFSVMVSNGHTPSLLDEKDFK